MTSGDGPTSPMPQTARSGSAVPNAFVGTLAGVGAVCLLLITVVPPGATRMYSWPWWIPYAGALFAPAGIVLIRAFDRRTPLVLPEVRWLSVSVAGVLVVLGSALASPYRSDALLWSAPYLSAIAVFFIAFDWLAGGARCPQRASSENPTCNSRERETKTILPGEVTPRTGPNRRHTTWLLLLALLGIVAVASMLEWWPWLRGTTWTKAVAGRNEFPLGHANYTAGLAILMLGCFGGTVVRSHRFIRTVASLLLLLAAGMLFTSGSRGGILAVVILAAFAILAAPWSPATKWKIGFGAVAAAALIATANPRTRAMFAPVDPLAPPNISNVQRSAMLLAGERMGADRPLLGWGPLTTPLAFPRYRSGLDGGAENVLQLHSLPIQLWAEFGIAGVLCAISLLLLVARDAGTDRVAAVALGGYAVFSLFDAQLDVPVFAFAVAVLAALVARPPQTVATGRRGAVGIGLLAAAAATLVVVLGHRDIPAQLNVEALRDEVVSTQPQRSIALLRQSLAENPDQEIAHFNLGWLLVVSDPAAAAEHFIAAAHLVPDKRGVYLGLGLARLNAGDKPGAARSLALEALDDPMFLISPWWKAPQLGELRSATLQQLDACEEQLAHELPATGWSSRELRYVRALNAWIEGQLDASVVAADATTEARRRFFSRNPEPSVVRNLGARNVRYQRLGYPVLIRNLDLPAPFDAWVSQESAASAGALAHLWPEKGWLPSPLVIKLLDAAPRPARSRRSPSSQPLTAVRPSLELPLWGCDALVAFHRQTATRALPPWLCGQS